MSESCANCGHDEDRHIFRDMGICLDCPCKAYKPKKVKSNHSPQKDKTMAAETLKIGNTPENVEPLSGTNSLGCVKFKDGVIEHFMEYNERDWKRLHNFYKRYNTKWQKIYKDIHKECEKRKDQDFCINCGFKRVIHNKKFNCQEFKATHDLKVKSNHSPDSAVALEAGTPENVEPLSGTNSSGCGKPVLQVGKKKWYCGDLRFQLCNKCKKKEMIR